MGCPCLHGTHASDKEVMTKARRGEISSLASKGKDGSGSNDMLSSLGYKELKKRKQRAKPRYVLGRPCHTILGRRAPNSTILVCVDVCVLLELVEVLWFCVKGYTSLVRHHGVIY
jgi:hypothetical protein